MLRIRIRDPVPFWPLEPGSRMGKKSRSGPRDEHPGSYFQELRNNFLFFGLKILSLTWIRIRDPESRWSWILDGKIRIRNIAACRYKSRRGTLEGNLILNYRDDVNNVWPDLPQEEKVDKEGAGDHGCGPEQKHQHEVSWLTAKAKNTNIFYCLLRAPYRILNWQSSKKLREQEFF